MANINYKVKTSPRTSPKTSQGALIKTYSPYITRREMESVLTCLVSQEIGAGSLNFSLVAELKAFFSSDFAIVTRTILPLLQAIFKTLQFNPPATVLISALAPAYYYKTLTFLGYNVLPLDAEPSTAQITAAIVEKGIKAGGSLLIYTAPFGNFDSLLKIKELELPIIVDITGAETSTISKSEEGEEGFITPQSLGLYTLFMLEEHSRITAGGGAALISYNKKATSAIKKNLDLLLDTDYLPDLNCALALTKLKNFTKENATMKTLYMQYQEATNRGEHKSFAHNEAMQASFFPLYLNSSANDIVKYAKKNGIEAAPAFSGSIIELLQGEEGFKDKWGISLLCSTSLYLRTLLFPLYPGLSKKQVSTICKTLQTLP